VRAANPCFRGFRVGGAPLSPLFPTLPARAVRFQNDAGQIARREPEDEGANYTEELRAGVSKCAFAEGDETAFGARRRATNSRKKDGPDA